MTQSTRWGVAASLAAALLLAGCGSAGNNPVQDSQSLSKDTALRLTPTDGYLKTEKQQLRREKAPIPRRTTASLPLVADAVPEPSGLLASQSDGNVVGTMGTFRLVIESDLTAHIEMPRRAQTQGDKYLLGIDQFFQPKDIRVTGVQRTGTDSLTATVAFSHPFKRPADLLPPATATKRLDLHVFNVWAGLLINGSENYFGGTVTTNTGVLRNADSYRQTGGMITLPSGINANVFPGKWVADQTPANTDPALDNYNPAANGWTGSNLQDPRGFGVFPQGATVEIPFEFDLSGGGPFTLDFAVLADYQDPRATPVPRNNRLPDPLDQTKLRYILPYGAGDLQKVNASVAGNLTGPSLQTVTVSIVDLDADAGTTASFPDNSNLSLMPFASGISSVDTSFPTGITASTAAEATGSGSGIPTSPKLYEFTISNTGAIADGDYTGMVRVVDQENDNLANEFYVQLDPNLTPLGTTLPIQVYQAVPFTVGTPAAGDVEIVFHGGATDPSFALTGGWVGPMPTQHPYLADKVMGLGVDQRTGRQYMTTHGQYNTLLWACPTCWKNGIGVIEDDGVNINLDLIMLGNNTGSVSPTLARPDRNRAWIVGNAHLRQDALPPGTPWATATGKPANPNGATPRSGFLGTSDVWNRLLVPPGDAFDGRAMTLYYYDSYTLLTNVNLWFTTYAGTVFLRRDYYVDQGATNPSPVPTGGVHQSFTIDNAIFQGNRGHGPRNISTDDLGKLMALYGSYVNSFDGIPANTTVWQYNTDVDYNDGTPEAQWGVYSTFGNTINSQNTPGAVFGAGANAINPNTAVAMDYSRSTNRLFVLDSAGGVKAFNGVLLEGPTGAWPTWSFSGITSPGGAIVNGVDVTVTKDNYVVVLDRGGPSGTDRLLVLDHDTLDVLATRDIANFVDGEVIAGSVAIAADDSLLNVPVTSAFTLIWDDPTDMTNFGGEFGGLYWYSIQAVP